MLKQKSMILVSACPLAKMFQRRWTVRENGKSYTMEVDQLVEDPDRVFKKEEFSILIPFSSGSETFWHGIPKPVQDEMRREVLVGGDDGLSFDETAWAGIVELKIDVDVLSMVLGSAAGNGGFNRDTLVDAVKEAERHAEIKCLRQARKIYHALKDQREKLKESGSKASYAPSVSEFLCAHVLANEEKLKAEKADTMRKKVDGLIELVEAQHAADKKV